MFDYIIAIAAPVVNCVQLLPQLYKAYRTQSVGDLSLWSLLLILLTNILWFTHGYFQMDWALLISGSISLCINVGLLCIYLMFEGKKLIAGHSPTTYRYDDILSDAKRIR